MMHFITLLILKLRVKLIWVVQQQQIVDPSKCSHNLGMEVFR